MDSTLIVPHPEPPRRPLPCLASRVAAGFPSPAADYLEQPLDLNELLVAHPASTFFLRVQGDSMCQGGILDGALVVIDTSLPVTSGAIVVAEVDGEFTLKRYRCDQGRPSLHPANPDFPVIHLDPADTLRILGVVTAAVNRF